MKDINGSKPNLSNPPKSVKLPKGSSGGGSSGGGGDSGGGICGLIVLGFALASAAIGSAAGALTYWWLS